MGHDASLRWGCETAGIKFNPMASPDEWESARMLDLKKGIALFLLSSFCVTSACVPVPLKSAPEIEPTATATRSASSEPIQASASPGSDPSPETSSRPLPQPSLAPQPSPETSEPLAPTFTPMPPQGPLNYRQEMKNFVQEISHYARQSNAKFIVIPQNGHELVALDEEATLPDTTYIAAINGLGREDLFYGYDDDNEATPQHESDDILPFLMLAQARGLSVLTTDYVSTPSLVNDAYAKNEAQGFIAFAAPDRELNQIPNALPRQVNGHSIAALPEAQNFLYLINPEDFADKTEYLKALKATDYDVLILDYAFEEQPLSAGDIAQLKQKSNGASRLVMSYMSIGEAEDYRNYWQAQWNHSPPAWLAQENAHWQGNYKVKYWMPAWKSIIYGNASAYLDQIVTVGFDGVYLDIIDAFEFFEAQ